MVKMVNNGVFTLYPGAALSTVSGAPALEAAAFPPKPSPSPAIDKVIPRSDFTFRLAASKLQARMAPRDGLDAILCWFIS
jgi:hypothetical protein